MSKAAREKLRHLMARYRTDALAFVQQVIRPPEISTDQEKLLNAVSQPDSRTSVASGTTTGKTTSLSWLVLWFLSCFEEGRCPCTATKYDQVTKTLWPEIAKWRTRMVPEFGNRLAFQAEKIFPTAFADSCFAWPMAAAKEKIEGFQGVHAENVLFVFDEAAGIPQQIFDATEGSCSTPGARWVCAGNPNRASGPFFDTHHKLARFWTTLSFSSLNSPFCSPTYAAGIAAKYGEESNMYRIRVLGKFPRHDPDTLIPFDWASDARERDVDPGKETLRIAGLDPSGGGADPVGFCIRQGTKAYGFEEWPAIDPMPTVGKIKRLWDAKQFDVVAVDCIGVGSGVVSRLLELEIPHIPVNVGIPSIVRQDCHRLRDELWWQAREWFGSQIVRIEPGESAPNDDMLLKFVHEATTPKYTTLSTGKVQVEAKDDLKKVDRLGHSPNLADAFCLTFAQGIPTRGERRRRQIPRQDGGSYVW